MSKRPTMNRTSGRGAGRRAADPSKQWLCEWETTREGILKPASNWSLPQLERVEQTIGQIAHDEFRLDTYPNQIEIITAEQMLDAYTSIGLPVNYHHWSFGKHFTQQAKAYQRGQMGLAYELVINSNPCIAYLMEENTALMQLFVIAHACFGHNSFFKGNHLFREWTDAEAIIDYILFARDYIAQCEALYGDEVETILDACHTLQQYGVDRYGRPPKLSPREERELQKERAAYLQSQVNDLWLHSLPKENANERQEEKRFPESPEENILYFIEKHSPSLKPWEREIVRIVRKISQYFYPQSQTQVMNEGWASFWHYTLISRLDELGMMPPGYMMEFLKNHTNVVYQPNYDDQWYGGINPYYLGFNMFRDIRRICEHPTDEDRKWFPDIAGSDWITTLQDAMRNYKDESFIQQFLSPTLIRQMHLFGLLDDPFRNPRHLEISAISDENGYREIRQILAAEHDLGALQPTIEVYNVDKRDRTLTLRHTPWNKVPLDKASMDEVAKHIHTRLWGNFPVKVESQDTEGRTITVSQLPSK